MAKGKSKAGSSQVKTVNSVASQKTNNDYSMNEGQAEQLKKIINDRSSNAHRIDEEIAKLEQACREADKAISGFREAANDIQSLEAEISLIFKGESSLAFLNKISAYKELCLSRIEHMEKLKSNYSIQIEKLKMEKIWAQNAINSLKEQLAKLRKVYVK